MIKLIGFYDYTIILTYTSLLSAIIGMTNATKGNFTIAIICLAISGICDAFDGMVARSKKNRTKDEKSYGIQLDSLVDVISFGLFPSMICYYMGVNDTLGIIFIFLFCFAAVTRLAFFNVLETARQKKEDGCAKYYRGLPVTTISIIFPVIYILKNFIRKETFIICLYVMLITVAFLFVLDFKVKKIDLKKLLKIK